MKDVLVKMFETKEVKVSNDGDKVNLVDIAKCCGLTRRANSGNEVVKWNNKNDNSCVVGKLKIVHESVNDINIKDEINNILIDIDDMTEGIAANDETKYIEIEIKTNEDKKTRARANHNLDI